MRDLLWALLVILPKNISSQIFGWLAEREWPLFSKVFKNIFVFIYKIDMTEAEKAQCEYPTLQKLFIRNLKETARPIGDVAFVSPVDGKLSQCGILSGPELKMIQAKGKCYSLEKLIGNNESAKKFEGGAWGTIYLAPHNYHRIHAPVSGKIIEAIYIPGMLWPVNSLSIERVEELFCVNERVITRIQTENGGECLVVKVGATNVGRIALSYTNLIVSNTKSVLIPSERITWQPKEPIAIEKGDELGVFQLGSTVVVITDKRIADFMPKLFKAYLGQDVKMGQAL